MSIVNHIQTYFQFLKNKINIAYLFLKRSIISCYYYFIEMMMINLMFPLLNKLINKLLAYHGYDLSERKTFTPAKFLKFPHYFGWERESFKNPSSHHIVKLRNKV